MEHIDNNKERFKFLNNLIDIFLFVFISTKTGVIKSSIVSAISLLLFIILIAYKIIQTKKIILTKQIIGYSIFGIFACASYFWALNKSFSMETIPNVIGLALFLVSLTNYINSRDKLMKTIKLTVISNTIAAIKIIVLYALYDGTAADRIIEITGIYFNTIGQVLGFSIIFTIYLYKNYSNKKYLLMVIPQFLAILLTESRKALLIPALGIIIILLLTKTSRKKIIWCTALACALILGIVLINIIDIPIIQNLNKEFSELFKYASGQKTNDWSINLRQFFIDTGIVIFKQNCIKGIGVNNFAYYVKNYTAYGHDRYSHNNYIELLSCLGIIGFILYYWIYIYIIIRLLKLLKKDRDNYFLIIAIAVMFVLMIMEYGIVSYTGCLYHTYITFAYCTFIYEKNQFIEGKKDD